MQHQIKKKNLEIQDTITFIFSAEVRKYLIQQLNKRKGINWEGLHKEIIMPEKPKRETK